MRSETRWKIVQYSTLAYTVVFASMIVLEIKDVLKGRK